jgi:uncharacterized damage-inducible protein DinB
MAIAELMLPEFDHEMATTRMLLERVPEEKAGWRPHARSMSIGELAMHLASVLRWASLTLERTEFDTSPPDEERAAPLPFTSTTQLLQTYDAAVQTARNLLAGMSDGAFMVPWTLKSGGRRMFSTPRASVFRSFVLNHAVHHRGQLTVYLRMLDVPIPYIYGPTADS